MKKSISKQGILLHAKKFLKISLTYILHLDRKIIYEVDLKKEISSKQTAIPTEFRWGTKEDILAMDKDIHRYDKKGKEYSIERMKKGDKILLAIHDNRIIGYQAFMKRAMELTATRHLSLPNLTVYFYKGFVISSERNKGIMDNMLGFIMKFLKQQHYTRGIGVVLAQNKPMMKVMSKLKFQPVGKIFIFRIFGHDIPLISKKTANFLKSCNIRLTTNSEAGRKNLRNA